MKKIFILLLSATFLMAGELVLDVNRSLPIYESKEVKVQDCSETSSYNIVGTLLGAGLGSLLGSQVGEGNTKILAVLGGAAAGALAGNVAQGALGDKAGQNCQEVIKEGEQILVGYKNIAIYEGREYYKITKEAQKQITIQLEDENGTL